jgi:diguanylate cyclase
MLDDIEAMVRGPAAYTLARNALEDMERRRIWPTPLNYELWLHLVAHPAGLLALEIDRILSQGSAITETIGEALAAAYLPKGKLNEHIRHAGVQLSHELVSVAQAIKLAQTTNEQYGETLDAVGRDLDEDVASATFKQVVQTLSAATRQVQQETLSLEKRLDASAAEVVRLREHLEQVSREATTDGLTKLANRKAFDDEMTRACAEATEIGLPLSLGIIDIDHFKRFNDTWGHQTGDQVLRYVASVIGKLAPYPRIAARFGGEEFAMIFPQEYAKDALGTLEEIRNEVSSRTLKRRSTNEDLGAITVSAGIADYIHGEDMSALIERADEALYASKHAGRNRTTCAAQIATAA